jgi:hypothetical protein
MKSEIIFYARVSTHRQGKSGLGLKRKAVQVFADAEAFQIARLPLARRTELACRHTGLTAPRQLDLVLDDMRFRTMTPAERQAVLRAMVRLLLEAGGVARPEISDDNA